LTLPSGYKGYGFTGASNTADGWHPVYDLWFPPELAAIDLDGYRRISDRWFDGSTNASLLPFEPLVEAAMRGELDQWLASPRGRLSLILVLDQFPRGLWAGTRRAFEYDLQALAIAKEGLQNGQYDALEYSWEKVFFTLPLIHAEGPDQLERAEQMIALTKARLDLGPMHLRPAREAGLTRAYQNRDVIARFGRHPHRNAVLGRASTPEEVAYIELGDFPHKR
jgi:uncharacterized protein (DUF924 family)